MFNKELDELAKGFLNASQYKIYEEKNNFFVADRLTLFGERDTYAVWTVPLATNLGDFKSSLLASISDNRKRFPRAKACLISRSRSGTDAEIKSYFEEYDIKHYAPVQFFDAQFKVDDLSGAAQSAIRDLRELAKNQFRVPQPYKIEKGIGTDDGDDLFSILLRNILNDEKPGINLVVGQAGIGKSWLFRSLFAKLYDDFLKGKLALKEAMRPVPLIPEHMKGLISLRTELLIENFLKTDVASPITQDAFYWLLVNGFATWLLDGLDELITGDEDFFNFIEDLLTQQYSKAKITIFCRDSLLTTSDQFMNFLECCGPTNLLKIYRLSEWGLEQKKIYAWSEFTNKLPEKGEKEPFEVLDFLGKIEESRTMAKLSNIPFYCNQMINLYKGGQYKEFGNEISMLNYVADSMIKREIDKGLIDLELFELNGLNDWLEQIARLYVENRYSEIDRTDALDYGVMVLRETADDEIKSKLLISLIQFPLFQKGIQKGKIAFTHELIAESIAARAYQKIIMRQPNLMANKLKRIDLDDPTILRFIASGLDGEKAAYIIANFLNSGELLQDEFPEFLTLLMLTSPDSDMIIRLKVDLTSRKLNKVKFRGLNLRKVSFRGSDLSNTLFENCDLSNAMFEGAYFQKTEFMKSNIFQSAEFGDFIRLESIMADEHLIEDKINACKWVSMVTGIESKKVQSCPAALQLRHLFGKFISPLGSAKRDEIKMDGLIKGKRYSGTFEPEDCVEEALREGYLTGPDQRKRFRRAEGDKYKEIVLFVRDGQISDGLGNVIKRLCRNRECMHSL